MFAYGQMLEMTHLPMAYYSSAEKDELVTYLSPVNTPGNLAARKKPILQTCLLPDSRDLDSSTKVTNFRKCGTDSQLSRSKGTGGGSKGQP